MNIPPAAPIIFVPLKLFCALSMLTRNGVVSGEPSGHQLLTTHQNEQCPVAAGFSLRFLRRLKPAATEDSGRAQDNVNDFQ